jgi:hypothetical protein
MCGYTPDGEEFDFDTSDHKFLAKVDVPEEWRDEPRWWDGWTAGMVRVGVRVIAKEAELSAEELLDRAVRGAEQAAAAEGRKSDALEVELAGLAPGAAAAEEAARRVVLLPKADVADRVLRYEGHLARQLTQTLHTLERLQAARYGNPPTPPAALGITVETVSDALPVAK